jgi:hypothetical protein
MHNRKIRKENRNNLEYRRVEVEAWMLGTIGKKVEQQEEIWIDI